MEVQQGEFIAIVGESGCGKSTMLDMLGLLLKPTKAELFQLREPGSDHMQDVMELSDLSYNFV